MLAVIRLKGHALARREVEDTLKMLSLKKKNTLAILPRTDSILGMLRKTETMVTWGEVDEDVVKQFNEKKVIRLKSPRKGLKSLKTFYPKGDLGYRGKEINELIKRMM
ncbi:MAG: uL30 family ribosomal protein [Candidatus Aenigmarchaeota archaeon]|nr:uL30 family ribosomal protein [Candidatus Aenigmarchaeota archaeon]